MNKSKSKGKAIQAERKRRKQEGTWVTKNDERAKKEAEVANKMWLKHFTGTVKLFEFQRRMIMGYTTTHDPKKHQPIKVQIEFLDEAGLT